MKLKSLFEKDCQFSPYFKPSALKVAIFLMFAMFLDYGGGIGIKLAATAIVVIWTILQPRSVSIYLKHKGDFIVFLLIPLALAGFNMVWNQPTNPLYGMITIYNSLSSPLLILLFPLFLYAGAQSIQKIMYYGFLTVASVMFSLIFLHYIGAYDVLNLGEIGERFRLGRFGLDTRHMGADSSERAEVAFFIAYALILGLGIACYRSPTGIFLIFGALILLRARGMILGGGLLLVALTFFNRSFLSYQMRKLNIFSLLVLVGFIILIFYSGMNTLLSSTWTAIYDRLTQAAAVEDLSTRVRIEHIKAWQGLIDTRFLGALTGFGPWQWFYDDMYLGWDTTVEMSILNIMKNYGIPYACLLVFWHLKITYSLYVLRRKPFFSQSDYGLIFGSLCFWLAGNTNPTFLSTPMSIFAFMLLRARVFEIQANEKFLK